MVLSFGFLLFEALKAAQADVAGRVIDCEKGQTQGLAIVHEEVKLHHNCAGYTRGFVTLDRSDGPVE
jgi:hypothetical protein